jgi:hypothetical protein|tara:strand:- start:761 stop:1168 length:408 start_codon:yes stop_codon:yes gene_type:complete
MGLVAHTAPQKISVPHESGQWLEVHPLSWADLESARRVKTEGAIKQAAMFDAETIQSLQGQQSQGGEPDPGDSLDMASVLNAGVKNWSYDDPVSPENIARLDEPTALWAFDEIVKRSVLTKDEEKNGSTPVSGRT